MFETIVLAVYYLVMLGISVYGFHALVLSIIYLWRSKSYHRRPPAEPASWPAVTVQLPVFNERHVIDRLISAVCELDYPPEALTIQVLDDSTDDTPDLARRLVAEWRRMGVDIRLIHRGDRGGYKAGALAAGMAEAPGDFVAIFDADFLPDCGFLRRLIPYLVDDPGLGAVQARWGHLNDSYNAVTRGQALSLDGQLVVMQNARQYAGLVVKFAGSAGIWRRSCIEAVGGWEGDTLTEDLDLAFRAALGGWRLLYLPEEVVPAEIPPQLSAYKAQLYRWAFGSTQVLKKLGARLVRGPLTPFQRLDAWIHLSAYWAHPLFMIVLLVCVPYFLLSEHPVPLLPWFWVAGLGGPLVIAVGQWALYPHWRGRLLYFPILVLFGFGFGLSLSLAVISAALGRPAAFNRTPKYGLRSRRDQWAGGMYRLAPGWVTGAELLMMVYTGVASILALAGFPRIAPLLGLISISYGFVAFAGLWQDRLAQRSPEAAG